MKKSLFIAALLLPQLLLVCSVVANLVLTRKVDSLTLENTALEQQHKRDEELRGVPIDYPMDAAKGTYSLMGCGNDLFKPEEYPLYRKEGYGLSEGNIFCFHSPADRKLPPKFSVENGEIRTTEEDSITPKIPAVPKKAPDPWLT